MTLRELEDLLSKQSSKIAELWLEAHLEAVVINSDDAVIRGIHQRSQSALKALRRAISSEHPSDWGSFAHREVVQIITLMARSLADGCASASTVGCLIPALARALEDIGGETNIDILSPLAGVVTEAYTAGRLLARERRHIERLIASTPILRLRPGVLLAIVYDRPDREAMAAITDKVLGAVLDLRVDNPVVLLELSNLDYKEVEPSAFPILLGLPTEVVSLGGVCEVCGISGEFCEFVKSLGIDLKELSFRECLEDSLEVIWPEGFLRRLGRAFR